MRPGVVPRYEVLDDEDALMAFKCLDPDGHRVEVYWEPLVTGGA